MFALRHVSKRHGEAAALDDLTLEFGQGTVTAIVGSSGAGKSSLLRTLLGLEWPDSGEVFVEGARMSSATRLAARRRIGYVIQEGGLFPHLTARGNLALLPRHLGWSRQRIDTRALQLAELMQLPPELLERFPGELSGGQRQRIAVMRALMTDPPALLLDEPLGALDPLVRFELQERLQALFRSLHKTVVLVTHDLAEAAYLATRLVLMRAGRVVQDGPAGDFFAHPADDFVRRFVAAQDARRPPPAQEP